MEHHKEFQKLLRQIMSQEPKPIFSEEEIHFDELSMKVMDLVGDRDHKISESLSILWLSA